MSTLADIGGFVFPEQGKTLEEGAGIKIAKRLRGSLPGAVEPEDIALARQFRIGGARSQFDGIPSLIIKAAATISLPAKLLMLKLTRERK